MKKTNPIRNLLGVSQEDMALILQVSRSQWAMYELGKRDLPTKAKLVLAEVLHYVKTPEMFAKSLPQVDEQHIRKQQQLERLLKENEYQQVLTAKKINFVERKYATKVRTLQVVDFLAVHPNNKSESLTNLLKTIANKASKALEVDGLATLIKYQIKQEVLELEKLLLESKLRKLTLSL